MATINDFKREISELVKAQKVAKRINHKYIVTEAYYMQCM